MAIGSPSSQCINWKWGKVKHRRPDNSAAVWHISASYVCITALSSVIAGWAGSGDTRRRGDKGRGRLGGGGGGQTAAEAHFCFTKHPNNVHIRDRYLGPFDLMWNVQTSNEQQGKHRQTQRHFDHRRVYSHVCVPAAQERRGWDEPLKILNGDSVE